MRIEQIHIKNYKMFKDTKIGGLSGLSVFLGVNGAGKTTFFDVIGFLHDSLNRNVADAIYDRGGPRAVWTRGTDPEKQFLFFEIKFRESVKGANPLMTYSVEIGFSEGEAIVKREILQYKKEKKKEQSRVLDFKGGKGRVFVNEEMYADWKLSNPNILAIKGLGQFDKFKAISSFRKVLERWHVFNFNVEAGRSISDIGIAPHLNKSGSNLA